MTNEKPSGTFFVRDDFIHVFGAGHILQDKALDGLTGRKFADVLDGRYLEISAKGLNYFERQKRSKSSYLGRILDLAEVVVEDHSPKQMSYFVGLRASDAWKQPDRFISVSPSDLEKTLNTLGEIQSILKNMSLSQSEKAQVIGTIEAAQELTSVPNPQFRVIKQLLRPLAHLSDIAGLVRRILDILP